MKNNRLFLMLFSRLSWRLWRSPGRLQGLSFYGVLGDRINDTPPQIAPAAASVEWARHSDFAATGGVPPYAFSVTGGTWHLHRR